MTTGTGKINISLSNQTNLKKALEKAGVTDMKAVTGLSVTGTFNHTHFTAIFENLKESLQELDLSGACYDAYFVERDYYYWRYSNEKTYHSLHTYEKCNTLVSISFPVSVTEIPPDLFNRFRNLAAITVPNNHQEYTSENGMIFNKDKTILVRYPTGGKGEYVIPDTVAEIGEHAFNGCKGLQSVAIPPSVKKIGDFAFSGCSGLRSLIIPDTVTEIGEHAFEECKRITTINIPRPVTIINRYAFYSCPGLTSYIIPDTIVEIGDHAFERCTGLTSITIPPSVVKTGEYAFAQCTGLQSVKISNPAIKLGYLAFYDCTALTSLDMPKTVKYKLNCVFEDCKQLPLYIELVKENEKNALKKVKIKQLKETSAKDWVENLMKNSNYPYKIIKQANKYQLLVMINEKQKLVIPIPLKQFQTIIPKIMETIQRFETAIHEFGVIYIDNMINDNEGWIIGHLSKARQKEMEIKH